MSCFIMCSWNGFISSLAETPVSATGARPYPIVQCQNMEDVNNLHEHLELEKNRRELVI